MNSLFNKTKDKIVWMVVNTYSTLVELWTACNSHACSSCPLFSSSLCSPFTHCKWISNLLQPYMRKRHHYGL
jgi:hypothetical protein